MKDNETPQYWETTALPPCGLVLICHGLNVKPSKMGDPQTEGTLVKLFLDLGYHVYCASLKGHNGPLENMRQATQAAWRQDAYSQYKEAKKFAARENLPMYLAGFSLGALVYQVLMNEAAGEPPVRFEKAILFSPAIATRRLAKTILWLSPFISERAIIKSASPKEYRAQKGASLGAYKAVFNMEKALLAAAFGNNNVETIVFVDKNDEMVSAKTLNKRINQFGLTNWKIHKVANDGAVIKPRYHHLLIDSQCVSESTWCYICQTIQEFINVGVG